MSIRMRAIFAGLFCLSVMVGCGGGGSKDLKLVPAGGSVTYKGSPLAGATVTFMPKKGPLSMAITDLKGEFKLATGTLPGCAVGEALVSVTAVPPAGAGTSITAVKPDGTAESSQKMAEMTMKAQSGGGSTAPQSLIPARYADPNTSGLSYTVDADSSKNVFKIELVD